MDFPTTSRQVRNNFTGTPELGATKVASTSEEDLGPCSAWNSFSCCTPEAAEEVISGMARRWAGELGCRRPAWVSRWFLGCGVVVFVVIYCTCVRRFCAGGRLIGWLSHWIDF